MPAKILPDKKVEMLTRQGLTPKQVAERLLAEDNIQVTPEAITVWRRRRGIQPLTTKHSELLPWTVKKQHQDLWPAQMLRLEGRLRRGESISEKQRMWLENWKKKLSELNAVVHYDPESEKGFYNVPRREGVDLDLIRDPSK